jgi:hypothetical protein
LGLHVEREAPHENPRAVARAVAVPRDDKPARIRKSCAIAQCF